MWQNRPRSPPPTPCLPRRAARAAIGTMRGWQRVSTQGSVKLICPWRGGGGGGGTQMPEHGRAQVAGSRVMTWEQQLQGRRRPCREEGHGMTPRGRLGLGRRVNVGLPDSGLGRIPRAATRGRSQPWSPCRPTRPNGVPGRDEARLAHRHLHRHAFHEDPRRAAMGETEGWQPGGAHHYQP